MTDRIPRYPGRVKITREDGTVEYATIERADDPEQIGTPVNKATLLTDDTEIKLFGSFADRSVNDALYKLSQMAETFNTVINYGTYVGTGTYGVNNKSVLTFESLPLFLIVQPEGGNGITSSPGLHNGWFHGFIWVRGSESIDIIYLDGKTYQDGAIKVSTSENSVYWYASNASAQNNENEVTYRYVAICCGIGGVA